MILGVGTDIIEIERISKAIGTGFRGFTFRDLEILRDDIGKPKVNISDKVKKIINEEDIIFHISISHNKSSAIAFATLEVR